MKRIFLLFGTISFFVLGLLSMIYGVIVLGSLYSEKYCGLETLHQEYELFIFAGVFFFIPFFLCAEKLCKE